MKNHGRIQVNWRYLPYLRSIFEDNVRDIAPKYALIRYSISILGSWNSHRSSGESYYWWLAGSGEGIYGYPYPVVATNWVSQLHECALEFAIFSFAYPLVICYIAIHSYESHWPHQFLLWFPVRHDRIPEAKTPNRMAICLRPWRTCLRKIKASDRVKSLSRPTSEIEELDQGEIDKTPDKNMGERPKIDGST